MSTKLTNTQELTRALNVSLSALAEVTPSQREQILLLKEKVENHSLDFSQLTKEVRKTALRLIQSKDKDAAELNISLESTKQKFKLLKSNQHLSEKQRQSLEKLNINNGESTSELIRSLASSCLDFAEDAIHLRSESQIIAGENNSNLKNSKSNVIAGDIAWSSKQIIKSLIPLLTRVNHQFPENKEIIKLLNSCQKLSKNNVVDFFEALSLMEESLRQITKAQGRKNNAEAGYLKVFHEHLKLMHSTLNETITNNSAFQKSSQKDKGELEQLMSGFIDASNKEDDPVKLKKIISENIDYMSKSINRVLKKQDNHISLQQRKMEQLRAEIRKQESSQTQIKKDNEILSKALKDIKELSNVDALTGVGNRRSYDREIHRINKVYANEENKDIYGLIVIDVDNFKKLNDVHGHNIGDKALKAITSLIKQVITLSADYKNKITSYRYGGEEFVLIYKNLSTREAIQFSEKIRRTIENKTYHAKEAKINITISIGIAYYNRHETVGDKVFEKADSAMYISKNKGRNRTSIYNQGQVHTIQPK